MRRFITPLLIVCSVVPLLASCGPLIRTSSTATILATGSAGYAGRFRIAHGRWPNNLDELERFICMPDGAKEFGLQTRSCEEVVHSPYRVRMTPKGDDLRMFFADASERSVCTLLLRAPRAHTDFSPFPTMIIETNVFSCRGSELDERLFFPRLTDQRQ